MCRFMMRAVAHTIQSKIEYHSFDVHSNRINKTNTQNVVSKINRSSIVCRFPAWLFHSSRVQKSFIIDSMIVVHRTTTFFSPNRMSSTKIIIHLCGPNIASPRPQSPPSPLSSSPFNSKIDIDFCNQLGSALCFLHDCGEFEILSLTCSFFCCCEKVNIKSFGENIQTTDRPTTAATFPLYFFCVFAARVVTIFFLSFQN